MQRISYLVAAFAVVPSIVLYAVPAPKYCTVSEEPPSAYGDTYGGTWSCICRFALQPGWLGYDVLGALDGSPPADHILGFPIQGGSLPYAEGGRPRMVTPPWCADV
jgi:hypothetical protein